jgi:hypothetical protein
LLNDMKNILKDIQPIDWNSIYLMNNVSQFIKKNSLSNWNSENEIIFAKTLSWILNG